MSAKSRLASILIVIFGSGAVFAGQNDIAIIKSRIVNLLIEDKKADKAADYLSSQNSDGSWPDIEYKQVRGPGWDPINALNRIKEMAIAYRHPSHPDHNSPAMKEGVIAGLTYWYKVNPTSANWFQRDIGKQNRLGPIGVLAEDYLPAGLIAKITADLPKEPKRSGANRVWLSKGVIYGGLLESNDSRIATGIAGIAGTINISYKTEGIQPDFSFHQHGPFLHNGGYGSPYTKDLASWIYCVSGTPYAFSKEKVSIISSYILDGGQWMIWGKSMDPHSMGREISRKNIHKRGQSFAGTLLLMSKADPARADEFLRMHSFVTGKQSTPGITGNKYFNRGDYMSQLSPKGLIGAKVTSNRMIGVESINGENLKGAYVAWGSTFIYGNDKTYDDIEPVWNWTHIPGITMRQKTPFKSFKRTLKGKTQFCGGTSDGNYGVAVMDLDLDMVQAHKGYFFFGEEMVALGAGISCSASEAVNTTLNQCLSKGEIAMQGNSGVESIGKGTHSLTNPCWIHHDDVGYVFPENATVTLKNEVQSGSWQEINAKYEADMISKDVFTLYVDHGVEPSSASYSYIVIPGATKKETESYSSNNPIRILANKTDLQAVKHMEKKVSQIIFYRAGTIAIGSGLAIAADSPCAVIVDEVRKQIAVSDPAQDTETIVISVSSAEGNDQSLSFKLPMENEGVKGTSVALPFSL